MSEERSTLGSEAGGDGFYPVAREGAIEEGHSEVYPVNGRMVAVFNEQGTYYAIDDFCPHMGASLGGGQFQDGQVVCPWHAWCFSIHDGTWDENPNVKVECFEVRVRDGEIQVRVPDQAG
jgi:nitrite reductase (NADH) small subunit/3-phenylpropionate/trans-cinnamate dioxygenase ferredoxin subunit